MDISRHSPIEVSAADFRTMGHQLVDQLADFLAAMGTQPVTKGEGPETLKKFLGTAPLPENGTAPQDLLNRATALLLEHSLFNGHPRFMGYITGAAAPVGALADLLAATVNPNVGAQVLSPMATEIEKQTVKWLAELVGLPPGYGGILVSGGNAANFTGFLAGRTAKAPKELKEGGMASLNRKLLVYCSATTHTWIEKAAVLFGLGSRAIRWIPADDSNRMKIDLLEISIREDLAAGHQPLMVVGTAGDVSTGAVDDMDSIGQLCRKYDLWFHIDGAYGMPAAVLPELQEMFHGIHAADSIALDPHKWLYSPLEAGCTLVKDPNHLVATFSSHPAYYNFDNGEEQVQNFYEYGMQNSRGFRALKVWLMLQQAGRTGYMEMIREDIRLAKLLFDLANEHPELEAVSHHLSITTFRYIPINFSQKKEDQSALNALNEALLNALQKGGAVFLSNALVKENYCLRACIVNFRTSALDIAEIIQIVVQEGRNIRIK